MGERPLIVGMPTSTFLPALGGAEVGLHNIALRLIARGHRPVIFCPRPHWRRLKALGWHLPYVVEPFPPKIFGLFLRAPMLGYAILDQVYEGFRRRFGIDVWHGTVGYPTGVSLVHYATKRNIPHLVRCAGDDIQVNEAIGYGMRRDPRVDAQVRHWLPQADRLVAITDSVEAEYHALSIPQDRIARLPNGVDVEAFAGAVDQAAVRRRLGLREDAFLWLAVGRNHPKKDFPTAVRALALLRGQGRACQLAVIGRQASELAPLVGELGLIEDVRLIDGIGETTATGDAPLQFPAHGLIEAYRAADGFAFPSLMETFGIVLVEAMAAGLPVVTTDAPGCRDVVRGGQDAEMVPPGEPEALAARMAAIMADGALRNDLRRRALLRARDFSWETIVDRYIALYRDILAEKEQPCAASQS